MLKYDLLKKVYLVQTGSNGYVISNKAMYKTSKKRQCAYEFDSQKDALTYATYLTNHRKRRAFVKESFAVIRESDNNRYPLIKSKHMGRKPKLMQEIYDLL